MIEKLERLRVKHKKSKAEIARYGKVSTQQYYNYLKTENIPYKVVENILQELGYKMIICLDEAMI